MDGIVSFYFDNQILYFILQNQTGFIYFSSASTHYKLQNFFKFFIKLFKY